MSLLAAALRSSLPARALVLVAAIPTYASAQVCFEGQSPIDARSGDMSVAAVDLDLDGRPDLVTAVWGIASGFLRVYRAQGSGAFAAPDVYFAGRDPTLVRSADLNGDGFPDLVVPGSGWGYVSVYLNQGNGTFPVRSDYDLGLGDADCVTCADFDGDGDVDLLCGNTFSPGWLKLFRNHGDGTFSPAFATIYSAPVLDVFAADFNGDGKPDIAALSSPEVVEVFMNLGGGNFASPIAWYVPVGTALHLAVADLDGDGRLDFAVLGTLHQQATVSVFLNQGAGQFGSAANYSFGGVEDAFSIALADLDGDADPEVCVTGVNGVYVLANRGNGSFAPLELQCTAAYPRAIDPADLDGDGLTDLAVVSGDQLWVMHNRGSGRFLVPPELPSGPHPVQVLGADFDLDGDADIAVLQRMSNGNPLGCVEILKNGGTGNFASPQRYPVGRVAVDMSAADLDGDGYPDIAVANDGYWFAGPTGSLSLLLNHGDGTFAPETRFDLDSYPTAIRCADLDGDGDTDIAVLESHSLSTSSGAVTIFKNLGGGIFAAPVHYAAGTQPSEFTIADLDGDGALDLIVLDPPVTVGGSLSVLQNLGNGTFGVASIVSTGYWVRTHVCGDVDGDGDIDIVVGGYPFQVNVLLNPGSGVFTSVQSYNAWNAPGPMTLSDVDGDGDLDLLVSKGNSNTICVLQNDGVGAFGEAVEFLAGDHPGRSTVLDIEGDGDGDLVCVTRNGLRELVNCSANSQAFCFGDATAAACPCNNTGTLGHGCENSSATGGAVLDASGLSRLGSDTLVLRAQGEPSAAISMVIQGTLRAGPALFGDGLRCLGGNVHRLYVHAAVGGVSFAPQAGDPSVSARSAALGDTIGAGSSRFYQVYYRDPDPAFCPAPQGSSWNTSSGMAIRWLQ